MTKTKTISLAWQDWSFLGLRSLLLVVISAMVFIARSQGQQPAPNSDIIFTTVIGFLMTIILLILGLYPKMRRFLSTGILLGDWLLAALLIRLDPGNPVLMLASAAVLMLSAAFRIGPLLAVVHSAGVIASVFQSASMLVVIVNPTPMLLGLILLASVALVIAYILEIQVKIQQQEIVQMSTRIAQQRADIRERTRALTEMSATLGSTINYEKVLAAAVEAGRLGMRDQIGKRLVSAVLLYRNEGDLQVVTSRGLTRADEQRIVPGKAGIIAQALAEARPIFGTEGRKDPELQYFVGYQTMRSLLCIPLRARYDSFGVLLYGSDVPDAFTEDHLDLVSAIGTQATIALQNAVLYRNLVDEKERIIDVDEDARKKLARDLHDGPTQNVSAIAMRMGYIYRLLERRPDEVPAELKKVEELARKTTREIRHMLFTLRPLVLESQGLTAALDQLAEKVMETHGQAVAVNVSSDVEGMLDTHQSGVIFYIVEEAVSNARKHAEAELISVNVYRRDDIVVVEIADNGVGFDIGAVDANYDQRGSLGMVNMRERTELLDGTLRIESAEGRGTTITVLVPIKSLADTAPIGNHKVATKTLNLPLRPGQTAEMSRSSTAE